MNKKNNYLCTDILYYPKTLIAEPSSCEIARLFSFLFDWQKRQNLSEK